MDLFGSHKNQTSSLLLEPLGTLFTNWQLARILGKKESRARQILEHYQQSHLLNEGLLSQIIGLRKQKQGGMSLINSSNLALVGEKRTFELSSRPWQFVMGLPGEVKALFYDHNIFNEANQAMTNGFLPLLILESAAKGASPKYGYVATVLFEPTVNSSLFEGQKLLLLSVLPTEFLNYFSNLSSSLSKLSVEADKLLSSPPNQIEEVIKDFWAIGSANLRDRYQLVTLLQARGYQCRYLSKNPEDEGLVS